MYLVAALGNPGKKYTQTRHNAGWIIIDEIVGADDWDESRYAKGLLKSTDMRGEPVECLKPQTLMNRSGESVAYVAEKQGSLIDDIIVLHDDVDLPLGTFRISRGKSAGGHNGVKSIIKQLGTKDFIRIRIGIAPTTLRAQFQKRTHSLSGYVLSQFSSAEIDELRALSAHIKQALYMIVDEGVKKAMNRFNSTS